MASEHHKVDLQKLGCTYLDVFFALPEGHPAIERIAEHLPRNAAGAVYRRSRHEHVVLVAQRTLPDGTSEYRSSWFVSGQESSGIEVDGDPWTVLDLGHEAADHAHIHCMFDADLRLEPKMVIPISPFASGVLPFNQLQGYRAALVEDNRTVWSAVIDWLGPDYGCDVTIRVDEYDLRSAVGTRGLLGYCASIRAGLMTRRDNE